MVWLMQACGDPSAPSVAADLHALTMSAERPADDPVPAPARGTQYLPEAECGVTECLVAWHDERRGIDIGDVYVSRVALDGAILDPGGLFVSFSGNARAPGVGFNGTNYLVVWHELGIRSAVITPAGMVLDGPRFLTMEVVPSLDRFAVASDGSDWVVVWNEDHAIRAIRVAANGVPVDPAPVALLTSSSAYFRAVDLAFGGGNFLMTWKPPDDTIRAGRVSPSLAMLDGGGFVVPPTPVGSTNTAVTFDGTRFWILWDALNTVSGPNLFTSRVATDGTVLGHAPVNGSPSAGEAFDIAHANGTVFAAWRGPTGLQVSRIATSGASLDPSGIPVTPLSYWAARLAGGPLGAFAFWQDMRDGDVFVDYPIGYDIYGARVGADGSTPDGNGFPVAVTDNIETGPAVVFHGTGYLAAWQDWRNAAETHSDVFGMATRSDGVSESSTASSIASTEGYEREVALAPGASSSLAVWRSGGPYDGDIHGSRLANDGTVLDVPAIEIATGSDDARMPAVASNDTGYLVAWTRVGTSSDRQVFAARIDLDGNPLDTSPIPIATNAREPGVASDGSNFLVIWEQERPFELPILHGCLVSSAGSLVSGPIVISDAPAGHRHPKVTWDGSSYVLVFGYRMQGNGDIYHVHAMRLSATGTGLDAAPGFPVFDSGYAQLGAVTTTGSNTLAVWTVAPSDGMVRGAWITPAGTVVPPDGFLVSGSPGTIAVRPSVGCEPGSTSCLIAYARGVPFWPSRDTRIHSRHITMLDDDGDHVDDTYDVCLMLPNETEQGDLDADGLGDICDDDDDGDTVGDGLDNCPRDANESQIDSDADGQGDACDDDDDADSVADGVDNCPRLPNSDQTDSDRDGLGDPCDPTPYPLPDGPVPDAPAPPVDGMPSDAGDDAAADSSLVTLDAESPQADARSTSDAPADSSTADAPRTPSASSDCSCHVSRAQVNLPWLVLALLGLWAVAGRARPRGTSLTFTMPGPHRRGAVPSASNPPTGPSSRPVSSGDPRRGAHASRARSGAVAGSTP